MKFRSTREGAPSVPFTQATVQGLAPDGGLYVPESLPPAGPEADPGDSDDLAAVAADVLQPFFAGDELESALPAICREAFSFPIPLTFAAEHSGGHGTGVLELFHGPTCAFKDVGARFLAACLTRVKAPRDRTVMVATSGDTGGAVAAALSAKRGVRVVILYPRGRISPRQEKQLTAWGDNVLSLAVEGTFDQCQAALKAAFADHAFRERHLLTTANSINIARLLPQMVYYISASRAYHRGRQETPGFVIPSGNVGNALAALLARARGYPIGPLVLALNENRLVLDYLEGEEWAPRPTKATLANAMDVGFPSNMERVFAYFPRRPDLAAAVRARSVSDAEIERTIARGLDVYGRVWDPHTATAVHVRETLPGKNWVVVSTAHPAKFDIVVEPLIGQPVPVPPPLQAVLDRPGQSTRVDPEPAAVCQAVDRHFG